MQNLLFVFGCSLSTGSLPVELEEYSSHNNNAELAQTVSTNTITITRKYIIPASI